MFFNVFCKLKVQLITFLLSKFPNWVPTLCWQIEMIQESNLSKFKSEVQSSQVLTSYSNWFLEVACGFLHNFFFFFYEAKHEFSRLQQRTFEFTLKLLIVSSQKMRIW